MDARTKYFSSYFERSIIRCANCAADEFGYARPPAEFFDNLKTRLPWGVRACLGIGLESGLLIIDGRTFKLASIGEEKGPYNWFSRQNPRRELMVNWEYFVQVAEFIRMSRAVEAGGQTIKFEDGLMDLAMYEDGALCVCCEVKITSRQASSLLAGIRKYEEKIDFSVPDRGNDAIRKAKYLVQHRPTYFSIVGIGVRREFHLRFPANKAFELIEDVIPYL